MAATESSWMRRALASFLSNSRLAISSNLSFCVTMDFLLRWDFCTLAAFYLSYNMTLPLDSFAPAVLGRRCHCVFNHAHESRIGCWLDILVAAQPVGSFAQRLQDDGKLVLGQVDRGRVELFARCNFRVIIFAGCIVSSAGFFLTVKNLPRAEEWLFLGAHAIKVYCFSVGLCFREYFN